MPAEMGLQRMAERFDDEVHCIDQRAVEVEKDRVVASHRKMLARNEATLGAAYLRMAITAGLTVGHIYDTVGMGGDIRNRCSRLVDAQMAHIALVDRYRFMVVSG